MPAAFKIMIGEKVGMTQMFDEKGDVFGVSVVKAGPCRVVRVRTPEKDGYKAVCLGFGHKKESHTNNAAKGIFAKLNMKPIRHMKEFRVSDIAGVQDGQTVTASARFAAGEYVDLQGVSKGKGFAGGMKRHNFSGQPAGHGASDRERAPGSLASRRSLGRVLPGQRMAGHMGVDTVTMQKIKIIKVIPEENLLLLNGSVPGPSGSLVYITRTVKALPKPVVLLPKKGKAAAKAAPKAAPAKK
ncbi:MAG: 50S ribosomal protein L3 [Elusimicrobia bacterium]|nr:50S ribosomal protein L3 [Elusimicrobiota bacterium]